MKQLAIFDEMLAEFLRPLLRGSDFCVIQDPADDLLAAVFSPCSHITVPVRCKLAVVPGEAAAAVEAEQLVTCGFSPRDTLTLSSAEGPLLSLQRQLLTLSGTRLEPQELKFHTTFPVTERALCGLAAALSCGVPVEQVLRLTPWF